MRRGDRVSVPGAFLIGIGRCLGSPGIVLGLWAINVVFGLSAACVVTASIREAAGAGRVHEELRSGFDSSWYGEFRSEADGIAATFRPGVLGVGAFLDNLEGWATGGLFRQPPAVLGLGAVYMVFWAVLLGGVLERYVHPGGPESTAAFLAGAGRFAFRFLRLAVVAAPAYAIVYVSGHRVYDRLEHWTRDVTSERVVMGWSLAVILATAFLLVVVRVVFAYAKIATVAEDRRSMVLAALRGVAFVAAHPVRTLGLHLAFAAVAAATLVPYARIAPGAGTSTWAGVAWGLLVAQAFLIARLALRLGLLGGEAALYRALTDE